VTAIWRWNWRKIRRKIWVPIAGYGVMGVLTALASLAFRRFLPDKVPIDISADSIAAMLEIIASSMLAITTFSVSIMIAVRAAAATGATPRATTLLRDDPVTQRVLATFVGAFIYSMSGLVGLQSNLYGKPGRVILFGVTLVVLSMVILQLVRWIGHLADYGRLEDTIARLEEAAITSMQNRLALPFLGGRPLDAQGRPDLRPDEQVVAGDTGYIQIIDMDALEEICAANGLRLALTVLPGHFVHPRALIAHAAPPKSLGPDLCGDIADCFAIAQERSFEQDPRFGIVALTEIASRALSPAINDPGTAIEILGRQLRILSEWRLRGTQGFTCPHVSVPPLHLSGLMADAFAAIARDGATMIEVQIRLQGSLLGLVELSPEIFGPDALHQSDRALAFAEIALVLEEDKIILRTMNADLHAMVGSRTRVALARL